MIIELGMESQNFYLGLIFLASFLFIIWFLVGRKGGYGQPTALNLKKSARGVAESQTGGGSQESRSPQSVVQVDAFSTQDSKSQKMRDVTPKSAKLETPPTPPPQCFFIYNGHDWDAFEVLGVSPYSSFSEVTKVYQQQIRKADPGKHEFLQTAYMAILKRF